MATTMTTTAKKEIFLASVKGTDFEDINSSINVITVSNGVNFLLLSFYINFILYNYRFIYYGYENIEVNGTAVFVDRRYSFFWVLILIGMIRIVLYILYQWLADIIRYSWGIYELHKIMNIFFIIFDIIYILVLLFFGWTCNSSLIPENPCNDPINYCAAYGNVLTTLCKTGSYSAFSSNMLLPNITFTADFWFYVVFLILDIFQLWNANSYHLAVARFVISNNINNEKF
jgi:hypothetical protein